MASLFRRDPEEDLEEEEEEDETDIGEDDRGPRDVPEFALIVSDVSNDGWHVAAVVGETANPDFYVRALTVRWPFLIARPARSNRTTDRPVEPEARSPASTTPARKLVVNWAWATVDDATAQLRFYVKRTAPWLFSAPGRVTVRLTLKESGWPRRRIVVPMKSNRITWNPLPPETPASPPEKST